jgi:hypothetical protein
MLSAEVRAVLEAATCAGVQCAVDCQCDGIFINGVQFHKGQFHPCPPPADMPPEMLSALLANANELGAGLRAAGWRRCGGEDMTDVIDAAQ